MSCPIEHFVWGSVDRSVVVPSEPFDGRWSKNVGVDHVRTKIRSESNTARDATIVPPEFGKLIFLFIECVPTIKVCDRGDADDAFGKFP